MTDNERTLDELARQPLDELDAETLDELRNLYDARDPVPDDLVERVRFAVALDTMFEEVAEMTRVPLDALATRGEPTDTRTETLTFSAERLTAMVTVTRLDSGRLRLDGWLAPPSASQVRLRLHEGGEEETTADEQGRFSFGDLDEGFAQLRFFTEGDAESAVVTPVFQL